MSNMDMNSTKIAKLAGVSRSTVSRVINNYPNVPPETKDKVMKVIDQYKYAPLASAQMLAGKKTKTIGLFIIDSGNLSGDMLSSMLIVSVIEHASALGYHVLTDIIRSVDQSDRVRTVKDTFYQKRIDAGLFIGAANHEPFIEELVADGYLIGIVDHELPGRTEVNRLVANFDNRDGMHQVLQYLIGLGHRRIGYISGDRNRLSGLSKHEAYEQEMYKNGLLIHDEWVLFANFSESGGYASMRNFLKSGSELPTAFVAANDSVAFGAIKALNEQGYQVPEDVSIIGFDDHALSERFQPPLSTARVDFRELTGKLTQMVIQRIERGEIEQRLVTVGYDLIIRASCKSV